MRASARNWKKVAADQLHDRREPPVEVGQSIRSQPLDFLQRRGSGREQRFDIDALTARRERRQIPGALRQHVHRAVVVEAPQMEERDADLQDPLIKTPNVARLGAPDQLERLVLLEVLAPVELRDALQQQRRR